MLLKPFVSSLLCLSLVHCVPLRLKSSRMGLYGGYSGLEMDSYGDSYGEEYGLDDHQDYGHDSYGSYGSFGGGFGSYAPIYETEYSGGYGRSPAKKSYQKKPKMAFKKSYEMAPLKSYAAPKQYDVRVPHDDAPVKVLFLTQHTPVHVQQKHRKGRPEVRKATTHEEPHVVVHEVIKPVIQEIREIILPYRKVIQKIEPVQEERKTIVAKDSEQKNDNQNNEYKTSEYKTSDYKSNDYSKEDNYKTYDDLKQKNDRQGETLALTESQMSALAALARAAGTQGGSLGNGLTLAQIFGQNASNSESKAV